MDKLEIYLTEEEVNKVLAIISEKPLCEVIGLFNTIRSQAVTRLEEKGPKDSECI